MRRAPHPLHMALLAIALLLGTNQGFATSFDCTRARGQVEKLICADPLLGRLDDALAVNYAAMLTVDMGRSTQSLRAEQLGWLARRNRCKDSQCLVDAYKERVDETCEYGVASGVHPPCSMADDVVPRHAQANSQAAASPAALARRLGVQLGSGYAAARARLLAASWKADSSRREFSLSKQPEYRQYPEVVCGDGRDAVCSGRFMKSGQAILLSIDPAGSTLPVTSVDED